MRQSSKVDCQRRLSGEFESRQLAGAALLGFSGVPSKIAELCQEALRAGISVESVRSLIQTYQLPAPATAGGEWPWAFKVYVMGSFRVLKGDAPLRFSRRIQKRTLELLQALIAFGGTEGSAVALTAALWPDSDGDGGYHALECGLYRLRQLLGEPNAVIMAGRKVSLDRNYFWVDMWDLERELRESGSSNSDAASRLAKIRQLYTGHFLEHESDKPWTLKTRQSLRDKFLRSIREAARVYESQCLWHEAAKIYQCGIELDDMAEDLYRGLMICHRELGEHTEVLQIYRRCRDLLMRVLGVPPNPKTQAIYNSARQTLVVATR